MRSACAEYAYAFRHLQTRMRARWRRYPNGSIFRVDRRVGLPFGSVMAAAADGAIDGAVWLGHAGGGATLWDAGAGTFKYFYGPRYVCARYTLCISRMGRPVRRMRKPLGARDRVFSHMAMCT